MTYFPMPDKDTEELSKADPRLYHPSTSRQCPVCRGSGRIVDEQFRKFSGRSILIPCKTCGTYGRILKDEAEIEKPFGEKMLMINPALFSSRSEEWETPDSIFNPLYDEFHFTLDVCATPENAKCLKYFTKKENGLIQDWGDNVCWMNPSYGKDIAKWMSKAYASSLCGATVVCLVHARTDTRWFHDWILDKADIRFLKGRVKFKGGKYSSTFPSIVVIYRNQKKLL
jgi:site-specific DNA-methyltransferase (adenine-specific)